MAIAPESLIFLSVPDRSAAKASLVGSRISRENTSAGNRFMALLSSGAGGSPDYASVAMYGRWR